jgi:hypothetical protein
VVIEFVTPLDWAKWHLYRIMPEFAGALGAVRLKPQSLEGPRGNV